MTAPAPSAAALAPDHLARQIGQRFMALLIPVTVVMGLVVWSTANLSPIYAVIAPTQPTSSSSSSSSSGDASEGASITDKVIASAIDAVLLVFLVLCTTLLILLLYYCRCAFVLYGWLMFSAVSIFFVMAWVWMDLVLTRFQIPYSTASMGVVLWNLAVAGTVSMFLYAHPLLTQGSLLFASVLVAWSMTALPAWTAWSVLLAIAAYDVVAVMCPGGPLKLLIKLSQERGDPIPGFIYDTDHRVPPLEATPAAADVPVVSSSDAPARVPSASSSPSRAVPSTAGAASAPAPAAAAETQTQTSREEEDRAYEEVGAEPLPIPQPVALPPLPRPPTVAHAETPGTEATTTNTPQARRHAFEQLEPMQQMLFLCGAPFKLGLGDFIFYSVLVGEAYLAGSFIAWTAPFLVVLSGMVATLASLLIRRGRGALPALPVSIFSATLMFTLCRVSLSSLAEAAAKVNLVL